MHDGAAVLRAVHQRDVVLDTVEGLHLEAPPVGPQRAADIILRKPVGEFVRLHTVMERADLEAELLRQIHHHCHLVGAVAVDVHKDVAVDRAGQRVHFQIALAAAVVGAVGGLRTALPPAFLGSGFFRFVFLEVFAGVDERRAITGDVGHARRRAATFAVDALRVFTAGHLQTPGRTRKFHRLIGRGRHVLQCHAATADQIRRTRQDLHRGHAAGQRRRETRILRPHRMLGPHVGRRRRGGFVAVLMRFHARAGVHAQMRMHVDHARRHPTPAAVHAQGINRHIQIRADCDDFAVAHQHVGAVQARARAGEHGRALDQHRRRADRAIRAGVGILRKA
jgi:hypothetical protein